MVNHLHDAVARGGLEQCVCEDGVHMTEFGNRLLAEAVAAKILASRSWSRFDATS